MAWKSTIRRFVNLIVDDHMPGGRSLRRIDLARHKLFNTTVPVLPLNGDAAPWGDDHKNKKMRMIKLPAADINFRGSGSSICWYINCFPLAGRKVLCVDQCGRTSLFDADERQVDDVPDLDSPKSMPVSIFVPGTDVYDESIYIMEGRPGREREDPGGDGERLSHQYEAFVYRRPTLTSSTESWQRQLLPPPPFVHDPKMVVGHKITSHAVFRGGSHVCISAGGINQQKNISTLGDRAGTYCLNTAKHTWTKVGDWTLPFVGKVEYVPELKLWFGICANDWQVGAADLSTMDTDMNMDSRQPQLVGAWKELEPPPEWMEIQCPQLVSLGSGRFCVARFFQQTLVHPVGILFERTYLVKRGHWCTRCTSVIWAIGFKRRGQDWLEDGPAGTLAKGSL